MTVGVATCCEGGCGGVAVEAAPEGDDPDDGLAAGVEAGGWNIPSGEIAAGATVLAAAPAAPITPKLANVVITTTDWSSRAPTFCLRMRCPPAWRVGRDEPGEVLASDCSQMSSEGIAISTPLDLPDDP